MSENILQICESPYTPGGQAYLWKRGLKITIFDVFCDRLVFR